MQNNFQPIDEPAEWEPRPSRPESTIERRLPYNTADVIITAIFLLLVPLGLALVIKMFW